MLHGLTLTLPAPPHKPAAAPLTQAISPDGLFLALSRYPRPGILLTSSTSFTPRTSATLCSDSLSVLASSFHVHAHLLAVATLTAQHVFIEVHDVDLRQRVPIADRLPCAVAVACDPVDLALRTHVAFSPCGQWLVAALPDGTLRVWRVEEVVVVEDDEEEVQAWPMVTQVWFPAVHSLAFSSCGTVLVVVTQHKMHVLRVCALFHELAQVEHGVEGEVEQVVVVPRGHAARREWSILVVWKEERAVRQYVLARRPHVLWRLVLEGVQVLPEETSLVGCVRGQLVVRSGWRLGFKALGMHSLTAKDMETLFEERSFELTTPEEARARWDASRRTALSACPSPRTQGADCFFVELAPGEDGWTVDLFVVPPEPTEVEPAPPPVRVTVETELTLTRLASYRDLMVVLLWFCEPADIDSLRCTSSTFAGVLAAGRRKLWKALFLRVFPHVSLVRWRKKVKAKPTPKQQQHKRQQVRRSNKHEAKSGKRGHSARKTLAEQKREQRQQRARDKAREKKKRLRASRKQEKEAKLAAFEAKKQAQLLSADLEYDEELEHVAWRSVFYKETAYAGRLTVYNLVHPRGVGDGELLELACDMWASRHAPHNVMRVVDEASAVLERGLAALRRFERSVFSPGRPSPLRRLVTTSDEHGFQVVHAEQQPLATQRSKLKNVVFCTVDVLRPRAGGSAPAGVVEPEHIVRCRVSQVYLAAKLLHFLCLDELDGLLKDLVGNS